MRLLAQAVECTPSKLTAKAKNRAIRSLLSYSVAYCLKLALLMPAVGPELLLHAQCCCSVKIRAPFTPKC